MPEVGGEHPRMGTHNCFLELGPQLDPMNVGSNTWVTGLAFEM